MNDELNVAERLSAPFNISEVKWKPQAISGNSALAVAFIDARVVAERLTEVFGIGSWGTKVRAAGDSGVIVTLRIKVGGEWTEHEDAGSFSDQPDDGDKLKAAVSDGIKRAAVQLGVGAYLYRLPKQWCDYDPAKKRFVKTPLLPAWAIPKSADPKPSANGTAGPPPQDHPVAVVEQPKKAALPSTGKEMAERMRAKQEELLKAGKVKPGELPDYVCVRMDDFGWGRNPESWEGDALKAGVTLVKEFIKKVEFRESKKAEKQMPWRQFRSWLDAQVTSIMDQGADLDAESIEQAALEICARYFITQRDEDDVPESVAKEVSDYLAKLDQN